MLLKITQWMILLFVIPFLGDDSPVNSVVYINKCLVNAQVATSVGNYERGAKLYGLLVDSLNLSDQNLMMNYAHCLFKTKQIKKAIKAYKRVLIADFAQINQKSEAALQLGVINKSEPEVALGYFQKALELNTNNETARYNFELTLQLLEMDPSYSRKQRSKANKKNPVGDSSNEGVQGNALKQAGEGAKNDAFKKSKEKDPNKTEKQAKAEAAKNGQTNTNDKSAQVLEVNKNDLKELNLSPEQAIQLLDAMQAAEIQYLQQAPKKRTTIKKDKTNYKDW